MATSFMNLDLPTVSVTLGPAWASKINAALETIDSHNHTSDKGVRIPTAGLNIDDDLNFSENAITNLLRVGYKSNSSTLTGATNALSTYVTNGNLYYTNSAGNAVQITSGGSVVSTPAAVQNFETTSVSSNLVISPADTFVTLYVDTSATRQITLPLAVNVVSGRVYIIKDVSGNALNNPITVVRQGSDLIDGQTSQVLESNYGSWMISGDAASNWHIL